MSRFRCLRLANLLLIFLYLHVAGGFIAYPLTTHETNVTDIESNGIANNGTDSSGEGRFFGLGENQRTFGFVARRRMQFALLPIMFKLGVISTMLVGITVMVMKGLTIGIVLLFLAFSSVFSKFKTHGHSQPVHFHLHPGDFHSKGHHYTSYGPSGAWDKASEDDDVGSPYEVYEDASSYHKIPHMYPYRYPKRHYHGFHSI